MRSRSNLATLAITRTRCVRLRAARDLHGRTVAPQGSGTATVASTSPPGTPSSEVIVNLANVSNAQTLTVSFTAVTLGGAGNPISVKMAVLKGDVNGTGIATTADTNETKTQALQPASNGNFRADVNTSGTVTTADTNIVKSQALTALPPAP